MKNTSISSGSALNPDVVRLAELIKKEYDNKPLCYVHSYGCAQNVSDGQKIMGILSECGYGFTDDVREAKLIVLNTCAVRENAEDRVFGNIGELKRLKENDPKTLIVVCGCMTQQKHIADRIRESYHQVDIVFGTYGASKLPQMIEQVLTSKKRVFSLEDTSDIMSEELKQLRQDTVKASIPIMYGCNNFCSYCIVPYVRGRERSREIEPIYEEAKALVEQGCKEITLLGQNVNSYSFGFVKLLERINSIDGDFRIRFVSSHPKDASCELIDAILSLPKVAKHLHLPVQSGCDEILSAMNRRYKTSDYLDIVNYARSKNADFSFSTDIIVGFPGETYEQFCQTKDFLRQVKFDNVFSYVYSKRSGTKAAELEDNISEKQKGLWLRELILEQREVATSWLSRFVGKTLRVLADADGRTGEGYLAGKSDENIIVEFRGDSNLKGQFVPVKITKAMNWALLGEIDK